MAQSGDWKSTEDWRLLSDEDNDETINIRAILQTNLPDITHILSSGRNDTDRLYAARRRAPPSRRQTDASKIVPDDVLSKLSSYEVALLLLSAYLHDIGMHPAQRKVSTHYEYILTGETASLSAEDLIRFRHFLAEDTPPVQPPLTAGGVAPEDLRYASKLTAPTVAVGTLNGVLNGLENYNQPLGKYATWRTDLIILCLSHHWTYEDLKTDDRLDPKLVGPQSQVVNLRYLACVLRLADVLEFDPERTPEIVFDHRDIDVSSVVH